MKQLRTQLREANDQLTATVYSLQIAGEKFGEVQREYDKRKYDLILMDDTSGFKRAEEREASVGLILEQEGLTEKLMRARTDWKRESLFFEYLKEYASNIRVLIMNK